MAIRGSQAGMAEALLHPKVGRNPKLEAINERVDWTAIEATLATLRPGKRGAPPYRRLMMVKALLLQQWYQLSDPRLEEELWQNMAFRFFVGLSADEDTPDYSTFWRFREDLTRQGLADQIFAAVDAQLEDQGLMVKRGTLIDATLIAAASRPPAKPADQDLPEGANRLVRSPREPEADWTRRGSRRVFGYKAHLAMDRGSGLIRRVKLTGASCNETEEADGLIMGDEQEVWADKAYDTHARRALLRSLGIKNRICRRGNKHHRLSPWSEKRNRLIGHVRGRVETAFAILKHHYGFARARYLTLARNRTRLILACTAINLRRTLVLAPS